MCHKCVKSDISDRFQTVFQIKQWQFSDTFTRCDTFLMHFQIFSYLFLTDISIWQFFDRILTHSDTKSPFYIWFGCKHSCIIGTISMNIHAWIINNVTACRSVRCKASSPRLHKSCLEDWRQQCKWINLCDTYLSV